MMFQDRERHLDLGGLTEDGTPIFERLAQQYLQAMFYIVDPKGKNSLKTTFPQNLIVTAPKSKDFFGFTIDYQIPYTDDFFDDARMDAVLDFMDYTYAPVLLLRVLREIKRVLQPNSTLTIMDVNHHKGGVIPACKIIGFRNTQMFSFQELFESGYPISPQIEAFHGFGFPVFGLQVTK